MVTIKSNKERANHHRSNKKNTERANHHRNNQKQQRAL